MPSRCALVCLVLLAGCREENADPGDDGGPSIDAGSVQDAAPSIDAEPPDEGGCAIHVDTRTVTCTRYRDPEPATVDDETMTTLTLVLAEGALDGTPRAIGATIDHVLTELSGAGLSYDEAHLGGLAAQSGHDPAITSALAWRRVHLLHFDAYDRVELTGTITVDAEGHGTLDVAWTDPAADRAGADSFAATF
ncbi:MAG: hypothetical protein M3Y87_10030 [Myxococcota bacterium]|nr:hypothetical protein [Myxococcota bacterium]